MVGQQAPTIARVIEVGGTVALLPMAGSMGMGGRAITTLGLAARAASGADEIAATVHGAARMADPARLGVAGVRAVLNNPTQRFVQSDGAQVFVQEVGGRFNMVVRGESGVVTTMKNLSQRALDRLGKKYGWEAVQ
jgi:hypothetical protein